MSPILETKELRVAYGGIIAVNDVSFQLEKGQILGIIGPNGAGKTTVFDAISGFAPATGLVVLDGVDISGLSPEKRSRERLGRSFQDAKLFPSLTVFETLCVAYERHINLRSHGVVSTALSMPWVRRSEKEIAGKVEDLIDMMGLRAFRDKFISELSTGSRRIVDLGVIMAHDPKVLLLDEPSSGIAQRETEALGPLLLRIREETGASLLVIEHDMPLIRSISDELLALETGSVMLQGTPDAVLNDPQLVAAYLGTDQAVVERSGARSDEPPTPTSTPAPAPAPTPAQVAGNGAATNGGRSRRQLVAGAATNGTTRSTSVRKSPSKTAATKKASTKKAGSEKTAAKRTVAKKSAAKKAGATKTAGSKKAGSKKAGAKRAATKKAGAKRAAAKKAATANAAAKKTAGKKTASKKSGTKKTAGKKAGAKKTATKRAR